MFRPFVGEVLTGTVVACDPQGVRVSIGFFDEIHVPSRFLQTPSFWSAEEGVWVWDVTSDDQLFYDLENPLRFRVTEVNFRHETNLAAASAQRGGAGGSSAGGGAGGGAGCGGAGAAAFKPKQPPNGNGGRGSKQQPPPVAPAMTIVASVNQPGLGLTSWWPPDTEGDGEEDEEDAND